VIFWKIDESFRNRGRDQGPLLIDLSKILEVEEARNINTCILK